MSRLSMSVGDEGGHKRRASEEAMVAQALERLSTVPLKLAAVLYAATDGNPMTSVARDDLLAPLAAIGCDNAANATQANRVMNYQTANWFGHNAERGSNARISLTGEGVDAITGLFTNAEGELDEDELNAVCLAINAGDIGSGADGTPPLSKRKQARGAAGTGDGDAPPVATTTAEVQVEACPDDETEEEDDDDDGDDTIPELQQRVDHLARLFDEGIQKGPLAQAYGELAAAFLDEHDRVPTSKESDELVRDARAAMYAEMEVGDGKLKRAEISDMFLKLQEASKLPGEVRALEARASTK
jgi:hypothetical protein